MRNMIIHAALAFVLILLVPPVNDLCREYVAGPSASLADRAAAYHGSRYITGQYTDGYTFVRVGESKQAGWGKEYYYTVTGNSALRFKVVSVFYWNPIPIDTEGPMLLPIPPGVRFGATYLLDRWDS